MIVNINHMSFTVSDLDTSIKFYHKLLGLKIRNISARPKKFSQKATGIKNAQLKIAYLNGKNCFIELVQYASPKGMKIDTSTFNVGSAHICFNVKDFHKIVRRLINNGVKFVGKPVRIPAGPNKGKHMVYLKDPDSNTLEFIQA